TISIGETTYPELKPGHYFFTDSVARTLTVPADTPPGEYYLAAFLPDDPNVNVRGFFPVSSNSSFSRSKITVVGN
ncbi:MAG: hypothetical protein KDA41_16420, partial [Planctomycetales bacterium]|nr:hypothetical protein [Planctomycetales bacterium]